MGLALLLQGLVMLVPPGVILCVHDDGGWNIESAASPCCAVCTRGDQEGKRRESTGSSLQPATPGTDGDDCRDYVLSPPDSRPSASPQAGPAAPRAGALLPPASGAPPAMAPLAAYAADGAPRETGPPRPPALLERLHTAVLRC